MIMDWGEYPQREMTLVLVVRVIAGSFGVGGFEEFKQDLAIQIEKLRGAPAIRQ